MCVIGREPGEPVRSIQMPHIQLCHRRLEEHVGVELRFARHLVEHQFEAVESLGQSPTAYRDVQFEPLPPLPEDRRILSDRRRRLQEGRCCAGIASSEPRRCDQHLHRPLREDGPRKIGGRGDHIAGMSHQHELHPALPQDQRHGGLVVTASRVLEREAVSVLGGEPPGGLSLESAHRCGAALTQPRVQELPQKRVVVVPRGLVAVSADQHVEADELLDHGIRRGSPGEPRRQFGGERFGNRCEHQELADVMVEVREDLFHEVVGHTRRVAAQRKHCGERVMERGKFQKPETGGPAFGSAQHGSDLPL